jgi:hypothetical protein
VPGVLDDPTFGPMSLLVSAAAILGGGDPP